MKKIKLSYPAPAMRLEKQSPGGLAKWGDCQFFINQEIEECDAWVVLGGLRQEIETTSCPPDNIIFVAGEPSTIWHYDKRFLKQFAKIITCQREIKGPGVVYGLQGHPWHIGLNHSNPQDLGLAKGYDELLSMENVPKTKLLSIITSNKQGTFGHRQRYKFALNLKEVLGDQADLFGRGINDFNDKWDALAPYKYSMAIENCSTEDYVSEKLFDCYLTHTFPFYYGAPNVDTYFPPKSYEPININDFAGSIEKIKDIINNPKHYQEHLPYIIEAKLKYLNDYNVFPLIANLISGWPTRRVKKEIILKNSNFSVKNYFKTWGDKISAVYDKLLDK